MSIWSEAGEFFSNLWNNVLKPDVQAAEKVAEVFFSAAVTAAANALGSLGLKIITDAVVAAETSGGSGADKLAAAQAKIGSDLSTAGIAAATDIVNAAIEAAVQQMKVGQAQAAQSAS